ncbi:hypothetical protein GJ744_008679 [Endocarpon pusillum]|uniref:Major facilitator superfamily (MFS) profile domain-containing protein n=1 Tax=Endocarpon pusillum TaxID=364733 RepID=A0A8H7AIZ7_9EURO|nr:hypothetical protein GJ744_008679 [Endocarpon pusillum]
MAAISQNAQSTNANGRRNSLPATETTPLISASPNIATSSASSSWPSVFARPQTKRQDIETASLLAEEPPELSDDLGNKPSERTFMLSSVLVSFLADATMVIAIFNTIGSDFGRFQDSIWIVAAYHLGLGPAQPLYGKLSDVFDHKIMLTAAYLIFGVGCLLCLIVHLVPLRDVAVWRSWMWVIVTFGRSAGAPVGELLADRIGWRGSFTYQAPLALFAMLLVGWRLPNHLGSTSVPADAAKSNTKAFQLRRVDFLGATLLVISIVAFLLVLNFASKKLTILDRVVLAVCGLWAGSSLLFLSVEAKYASEPIFPLQLLLRRDLLTAYLIAGLMTVGHLSMLSSVALYFRVTSRASNAVSSAHLLRPWSEVRSDPYSPARSSTGLAPLCRPW